MSKNMAFVPAANLKNPTQCCGNFGTEDEWQCMYLNCDDVFHKGSCELAPIQSGESLFVHDIFNRPKDCPLNDRINK